VSFNPAHAEAAGRPYPDTAAVEAMTARINKQRLLDKESLRTLGDIPLRTFWFGLDWQRVLTTALQGNITLPDLPGLAIYVRPNLRRFCAALDEAGQGLWDQTILVGATDFQQELLRSPYVQQSCPPPKGLTVHDTYATAFTQASKSEPGLQIVCFDAIDDTTSQVDTLAVTTNAAEALDPAGLFIIGGEVHTDMGRQCLRTTVDSALELFGLEYEQEYTSSAGTMNYQAVLVK
jgi:hypothetical protein